MLLFSDMQETAGRYGKYIPEFQELFQKHEVSFGTPKDFFRLAPKLAYDEDFRVEFTSLVKSVGQREEGRLSLTQMLTIIAVAMGGTEIEGVGSAGAVPISLVVVFLAEMGGWSEGEAELAGASEGEGEAVPAGAAEGEVDDEREAAELERRLALGQKEGLEGLAASLFSGPGLMKDALSRLELNTLQLKHHLDSIDTRMERIEPHLDDLTWRFGTRGEAATEERKRKTGTSGERPSRFSSESEMRPWPTKKEEEPEAAWERSAPAMRPWPVEKEPGREAGADAPVVGPEMAVAPAGELANESVRAAAKERWVETARPRPASEWRAAVASLQERERREALLREPVREAVPKSVMEPVTEPVLRDTLVEAVPEGPVLESVLESRPEPVLESRLEPVLGSRREPVLREPLVREVGPEPLLREPAIRVPFGEYLRDEDEEVSERRWGRWVVAALLLIGVASGAMVYRSYGWQGFSDGWQHGKALVSAAVAKTRLAAGEAKELTAKPAASASGTPSAGSAAEGGGGTVSAPAPVSAPVPPSVSASTSAPSAPVVAAVPSETSAPRSEAAEGGTVGVGSTGAGGGAGRTSTFAQKAAAPEAKRKGVVVEEAGTGGGTASSGRVGAAPPASVVRAFGGSVAPSFVEASQLTILSKTQPEYPDDAFAQKVTGEVVVQAIISPTGAVESAQIVSGPAGLLKASLDAMKGWRYRPYLVNGEPVEVRTFVKFRFERDE